MNHQEISSPGHLNSLRKKIQLAGCFTPTTGSECTLLAILLATGATCGIGAWADWRWMPVSLAVVMIAFTQVQAGLIAHEAVHGNLGLAKATNLLVGELAMTLFSGISYRRFEQLHTTHHQFGNWLPLVARIPVRSTNRWQLRFGKWCIMSLTGFLQKYESLKYVVRNLNTRPGDAVFLVVHYVLWIGVPAVLFDPVQTILVYLAITLVIGPYAAMLYFITHEGMAVIDPQAPPPYLDRHLESTRDLGDSLLNNLLLGGVNHHVAHHVAARIPRLNLSSARAVIRNYCHKHGLYYEVTTTLKALRDLLC